MMVMRRFPCQKEIACRALVCNKCVTVAVEGVRMEITICVDGSSVSSFVSLVLQMLSEPWEDL